MPDSARLVSEAGDRRARQLPGHRDAAVERRAHPEGHGGRTLWEEGREPGRQLVALGAALTLSAAVLDVLLGEDLGLFFDLCFVGMCLALALLVRPTDFFPIGVLPPLLMLGVLLLLDVTRPTVLGDPADGVVQSVVTGLAQHSGALVAGYALCLATLAVRHRFLSRHRRR